MSERSVNVTLGIVCMVMSIVGGIGAAYLVAHTELGGRMATFDQLMLTDPTDPESGYITPRDVLIEIREFKSQFRTPDGKVVTPAELRATVEKQSQELKQLIRDRDETYSRLERLIERMEATQEQKE